MATYVLIHGSWHGAWCWYKVIPLLEQAGHTALALDLPGHGRDWTPARDVTLQSYVDAVCRVLDAAAEPVILVGHSRGGIVISQTAEQRPDKVRGLVYLAAYLIPDGQAMLPIALGDTDSLIAANLVVDEAGGSHMLQQSAFRDALYADCPPEDLVLAAALLTPEPNAPVATPLHLTPAAYGRIPRAYIQTRRDRGVTPALQQRMLEVTPCPQVLALDTSHSPFLSAPDELVQQLTALRF